MKSGFSYRFMSWYDGYWRRKHGVEKFDELLSFSFENFEGPRRQLGDGTWIEIGDRLAVIHFNRECFSGVSANPQHYLRNGLRFRKLLLASLRRLAATIEQDERFRGIEVLHGVSWLPPHGEKLGFFIEPRKASVSAFFQAIYFRVLLKTFFPHVAALQNGKIQAHAYWLTRRNLHKYFSREPEPNEYLISQDQGANFTVGLSLATAAADSCHYPH